MNDDELRQAMATLESLKLQLDAMAQQSKFFQLSLEETLRARDTLEAFSKAKEGDEVLIPAGASTFVFATATKKRKAVVGIGNKVSIDMDIDKAAEYMKSSVVEVEEAIKKLTEAIKEADGKYRELALQVNQEYKRRQQ